VDPAVELVRAAWAQRGVTPSEEDLQLVAVLGAQFAPAVQALLALDVSGLPLEGDLDPGRPPR
jgi:hypothetical protein